MQKQNVLLIVTIIVGCVICVHGVEEGKAAQAAKPYPRWRCASRCVLPATQAGMALSRKGVAVTAFGENPDGDGLIFRVWEQGGVSGKLTVNLPKGMKAAEATPVTLRGEKTGKSVTIKNGLLEMYIGSYAPASFVLEGAR